MAFLHLCVFSPLCRRLWVFINTVLISLRLRQTLLPISYEHPTRERESKERERAHWYRCLHVHGTVTSWLRVGIKGAPTNSYIGHSLINTTHSRTTPAKLMIIAECPAFSRWNALASHIHLQSPFPRVHFHLINQRLQSFSSGIRWFCIGYPIPIKHIVSYKNLSLKKKNNVLLQKNAPTAHLINLNSSKKVKK